MEQLVRRWADLDEGFRRAAEADNAAAAAACRREHQDHRGWGDEEQLIPRPGACNSEAGSKPSNDNIVHFAQCTASTAVESYP